MKMKKALIAFIVITTLTMSGCKNRKKPGESTPENSSQNDSISEVISNNSVEDPSQFIVSEEPSVPHIHSYGSWIEADTEQHKKTCECGDEIFENHSWDEGVITTPATHLTEGVKTFTCDKCGATKIEPISIISEHNFVYENIDEENHIKRCECGESTTEPHSWDGGVITTPATHLTEGVKTFTCDKCGATKIEPISIISEHNYGEWIDEVPPSPDNPGIKGHFHCECGKDFDSEYKELTDLVIPAVGHEKVSEFAEVPATCETTGTKAYYVCVSGCKHLAEDGSKVENDEALVIAPKGHDYVHHDAVSPTVDATGNIEFYSCSRCSKVFTKSGDTYTETTMDAVTIAKLQKFTVTFDVDGGEPMDAIQVVEGTKSSELSSIVPTKSGYSFLKWQLVNGQQLIDLTGEESVQSNVTVKAIWSINNFEITVKRANGSEEKVTFNIENRVEKLAGIALTPNTEDNTYSWKEPLPQELELKNYTFEELLTTSDDVYDYPW